MSDPYLTAWWRQRRNRARSLSAAAHLRDLLLPLAVAALLVPLVRPTFLGFLDAPREMWGELVFGLVMRASMVIVGIVSIDVYTALVRGPTREVLSILPVDPALVARAELVRVFAERWWLMPSAAIVLSPLGFADLVLWAAALAALSGCFVLAITASAAGHLLAIHIAESPHAAPLLDALRGNNPRPQAAFLYAPGAVLLAIAGALYMAASAVPDAASGHGTALLRLSVPFLAALLAALAVPPLARSSWFRGSIVLSEIDARYASVVDPEEARHVYLDWMPRHLPASWRPFALNDLRHGWRARRTPVVGAWLCAILAFGLGLGATPDAPSRALAVVVLGVFAAAANGVLMNRDVPPFLAVWLATGGLPPAAARAVVLGSWAAPPVLLTPVAVWFRHGSEPALMLFAVGIAAAVLAVALSLLAGRSRERGVMIYVALSALMGTSLLGAAVWMGT